MKKEHPLLKMFVGYGVLLIALIFTIKYAFKFLFPDQDKKKENEIKKIAKENNLDEEQAEHYYNIAHDIAESFKTKYLFWDWDGWGFKDIPYAITSLKKIKNEWEFKQVSNYYNSATSIDLVGSIKGQEGRRLKDDIRKYLSDAEKAQLPNFILK